MGKRLYVGNLPYDADEASLREAFSQDGRIVERVHIVLDRETQRPRGFAFVEMANDEQAKQAMATLDGSMFGTRQLRVTEAEERRTGPGGPSRGPGGPPRSDRGPGPGPGGPPRPGGGAVRDDDGRGINRFGPDAKPRHQREAEQRRQQPPPRRRVEDDDDEYGGRRGHRRFEDDDE